MPTAHPPLPAHPAAAPAPVVIIGRPGCHLCEQASEIVQAVAGEFGLPVGEVSIDDDASLRAAYGEMIPVILIDQAVHDYWRVDPARLRAALRARGPAASP